jgi:hypothetical protein
LKKTGKLNRLRNVLGTFLFATLGVTTLFISLAQAADDVKVQATTDSNNIGLGDTVTVTVSVTSADSLEAEEPKIPHIDGLNLLNSWSSSSTSSRLMQGNGGMKFETVRRQDFNYTFSPKKLGTISVGPFQVVVNGKTLATKPFTVKVENGRSARNQPSGRQVPPDALGDPLDSAEAIFQQMLQNRGMVAPPTNTHTVHNPNESFFVQLDTDKTSVYEGEQITANWYIFTRGNILSLDRVKFPDLKGFWKEIIEEVPALNFQQEVVNGVPYRKALLASHALFPIKAGTAVIDEYKIKANVQVSQGPFGFGPAYSFTRTSERLPIKVIPLPTEGRPSDFTGAVGEFNVTASVEGKNFPMNQPFTLKVRFEGTGNAKNIDLPPLQLPPGVEIYDTKNESKFFKNGHSFKEFTVLIIPRQQGEIEIPELGASMFDPQTKRYYRKSAPPIKVLVGPPVAGENQNSPASPSVSGNETKETPVSPRGTTLPEIVRIEIKASRLAELYRDYQTAVGFCVWVLCLLLSAFRIYKNLFSRESDATLGAKLENRAKVCKKRIEAGDFRGAGTEVTNLIYDILGEIAGEKGGANDLQKLLDKSSPSIRRELGADISKQIDLFQTLGFAPDSATEKLRDKNQLRKELDQVIKTLKKAMEMGQRT